MFYGKKCCKIDSDASLRGDNMSEVKIMVPKNVADDLNRMTTEDIKMLMALYYYISFHLFMHIEKIKVIYMV